MIDQGEDQRKKRALLRTYARSVVKCFVNGFVNEMLCDSILKPH